MFKVLRVKKKKAVWVSYQGEEVVQLPEDTPADDHEEVVHDGQVDHHQPVVVVVSPGGQPEMGKDIFLTQTWFAQKFILPNKGV